MLIVEDAAVHPTFAKNQLVLGEPHIRFYAGMPLITSDGLAIGTICVLDHQPRPGGLTDEQRLVMEALAEQVMATLELRRGLRRQLETERLLSESYDELEQVYRYAPVGLFTFDREYRFRRINERMAEINGLPIEDHIGRSLWEVVPELADHLVEVYRPVFDRAEPVLNLEIHGETPAQPGVSRTWLANYYPRFDCNGEVIGLIAAVMETTERSRAEAQLKSSQELLTQAVRLTGLAVFEHDHGTDTFYWSEDLHSILMTTPEDASLGTYISRVHSDDRQEFVSAVLAAHGASSVGICEHSHRIVRPDGEIRYVRLKSQTLFEGAGDDRRPTKTVGAILDVSGHHAAEKEIQEAHENLLRISRLSAMGSVASTIAHEINQPLTSVSNFLAAAGTLLSTAEGGDEKLAAILARAAAENRRASEIVRRVRRLARTGEPDVEMNSLRAIAERAWSPLRNLPSSSGVSLEIRCSPTADVVTVDPVQFEQVLSNLFRNAVDAMAGAKARKLMVSAQRVGSRVRISVRDTGPGIPANLLPKLFEPLRTTKEEGLGLGLPLCRSIVEAHHGTILARNHDGVGAEFVIEVPIRPAEVARNSR